MDKKKRVVQLVLNFIAAYHRWEEAAYALDESSETGYVRGGVSYISKRGMKVHKKIAESYEEITRPFLSASVKPVCRGWGIPPKHDPQHEKVVSVVSARREHVVTTELKRDIAGVPFTDTYAYHVVFEEDTPRIRCLEFVSEDLRYDTLE